MQTHQADYFGAYRTMKMIRDASGVLVVEFHSNGGPCTFSAQHHTEVVDAFHRIAQDRANKIVILTGAGGDFIIGVDWASFGNVADPGVWSQIHDEGTQVLENIANIRVPVIAAIEGRAHIQAFIWRRRDNGSRDASAGNGPRLHHGVCSRQRRIRLVVDSKSSTWRSGAANSASGGRLSFPRSRQIRSVVRCGCRTGNCIIHGRLSSSMGC
jgi:hypothetical protein